MTLPTAGKAAKHQNSHLLLEGLQMISHFGKGLRFCSFIKRKREKKSTISGVGNV